MQKRTVPVKFAVQQLTPEEVFDILKHKDGHFSSDYDGVVSLVYYRDETDDEAAAREARERAERARREAIWRADIAAKEAVRRERAQAKKAFSEWKRAHPAFPEYIQLKRNINMGPLTLQDTMRHSELKDLFDSDRSRQNFDKFMGFDQIFGRKD